MPPQDSSDRQVSAGELLMLGGACLCVGALVAWLNQSHDLQRGVYIGRYLELARFLLGEVDKPVLTYPAWGYPLVLAGLSLHETASVALQLVLCTASLVAVYASTASHLRWRAPLAVLCVLAVPWYALASVKLADIWSASLGVIGLCLLARAVGTGATRWSVASGLVFGIGLNFRSDFLPVLVALPLLLLVLSPGTLRSNWRHMAIVISLAVLLLIPWGLFRSVHGRPFGITSTNAGVMLYNSLGFAGNSWGIVSNDRLRVQEARAEFGANAHSTTPEANAWFRSRALRAIRSDPLEFGRKIAHNLVASLKYGFYGVEMEPHLSERELLEFEVLKEQLKVLAGSKQNPLDIQYFREQRLWNEDFSLASVSPRQWIALSWPLFNIAMSSLYLVMLLIASARLLLLDRERLGVPIFLFSLAGVIAVWSLLGILQYEPRQANVLYPLGLPIVAASIDWLGTRWHFGAAGTCAR